MNQSVISSTNLTRDFKTIRTASVRGGSPKFVRAVNDLTLEIPRGIVFGFLGPNGSGKTTTIRLLLGLLEPTTGSAKVLGFDTLQQGAAIRERTGALLEHTGLYERLSAEDNLEFYGRVARLPTRQRRARIQELLEHMGLWERRKEVVVTWSRGMKQKLAIARVLLHRPELIFLDEPTAGLDPVAAAALRDDLAQLASDRQTTIFLTTHNLTDAEKLCEKVAVIRSGKLLAVGRPEELRTRNGIRQIQIHATEIPGALLDQVRARPEVAGLVKQGNHYLLDLRQEASTAPIVTQLALGGVQIEQVSESRTSLEEIFLDLVEDEEQKQELEK